MTIPAGMVLFLLGVCSAQFVADLLLGDDSFRTFYLKYGCTEALWVFPIKVINKKKSERKGVLYVCLCTLQ